MNEPTIVQVVYGDQWLEITYVEAGGVSPNVRHIHTLQINPGWAQGEIIESQETLADLVDRALVEERHPPEKFTASREP